VGTPTTTNYAAVCLPDETSVTWNQTGPTGPTGPTGAPGGPGTPGQQGAAGTNLVGQTSFGLSGGGNTFLKIEGIKGESKDKLHPDEIELDSVAFTVNGGGAGASGGGGGAGKVAVHDISFTHKVDKASPVLFQAAATGKHFQKATISFSKVKKGKESDYLVIKLTNVDVSSVQQGVSEKQTPTESVTLNFSKVSETYYSTDAKGKKLPGVTVSVNVSSSVKLR
jgi:type VI secretion system secreted protein Hcp